MHRLGLLALIGALGALGLAPLGWWWFSLLSMMAVPLFFQAATSPKQAALTGWAYGFGWFLPSLVWIIEPFLVDVARHGWMAPFALLAFSGGMALFWSAAFWGAYRLARAPWMGIATLILMLSLAEFARAYVLTGLPWAAPAQIWVNTSAIRLLAWIGPHGLGLLTVAIPLASGFALTCARTIKIQLLAIGPMLALLVAVFGADLAFKGDVSQTTDFTVRLIQPNAPQHQKWDPDYIPVFFQRSIGFTAAKPLPNQPKPDLIVWPETSVPTYLHNAGPTFAVISDAAGGTPVVAGIQRLDGDRLYNTLVYLDETGHVAASYDKHHLVPFGEYVPFGDLLSQVGLQGLVGNGFQAGAGPQIIELGPLGKALPLICYEAVFPQDVNGAPERADFLLLITNDGWFGQYSGPYQHLAQAQMRAVEQGLPMIRAANTGVSAMIDPLGRITASLPLGISGFLDAALPIPLAPTLYSRSGDLPLFLLLLLLTMVMAARSRRHRPR